MPATCVPPCPSHLDQRAFAAFYQEYGYAIARNVVGGATLHALQEDFDRCAAQLRRDGNGNARWGGAATDRLDPERNTVILHTHQIQSWSAAWGRFCYDEAFLDVLSSLMGPDLILHHSKLFEKPAGIGAPFPPHQDWSYFPCDGAAMLAAVVSVSDTDESNGCIHVWPGSHRLGRLDPTASKQGLHGFDERFPFAESVPCVTKAGDIIIFSDTTVHGSLPNRGGSARKSVLFQIHSGADELDPKFSHPYAQLVLRGWNHRMNRMKAR